MQAASATLSSLLCTRLPSTGRSDLEAALDTWSQSGAASTAARLGRIFLCEQESRCPCVCADQVVEWLWTHRAIAAQPTGLQLIPHAAHLARLLSQERHLASATLHAVQAAAAGAARELDRQGVLGVLCHAQQAFPIRAHTVSIGRASAAGAVDVDLARLGGSNVRRASRLQVSVGPNP